MMRPHSKRPGHEVDEAATLVKVSRSSATDEIRGRAARSENAGMDGLETLRQLKQRLPEACVTAVTGVFASIDLAVDAMRLGATDFLRKPMTPDAFRGQRSRR
jgi:DNA-binding NtrC family response regulator